MFPSPEWGIASFHREHGEVTLIVGEEQIVTIARTFLDKAVKKSLLRDSVTKLRNQISRREWSFSDSAMASEELERSD